MNFSRTAHWVGLVLSLWVVASPWVLGFSGITPALWSNVAAGLAIFIFCLWALFGEKGD